MSHKPMIIPVQPKSADADTVLRPQDEPPIAGAAAGHAMQAAARLAGKKRSILSRLFWPAVAGFIGVLAFNALWGAALNLLTSNPMIGMLALGFGAIILLVLILMIISEIGGYMRLAKLDRIRDQAEAARSTSDLEGARRAAKAVRLLTLSRKELDPARRSFDALLMEEIEAENVLRLAERELLADLDKEAIAEVEVASRQVASVTALVPLALIDVISALFANLRMIRRIGEIYGGRGGSFASWRLAKTVFSHLLATGAMATGDDLIESFAGGGVLSKISRRFGEGLINGALTARVGLAAIEVTRPLPLIEKELPGSSRLVRRALAGFFTSDRQRPEEGR